MRAAIVSPSAPVTHLPERLVQFEAGLATLARLGIDVVEMPHVRGARAYASGTVAERLADLHAAYADDGVNLLIAANGGRSCNQLLDGIDLDLVRAHPKPLVGFSDVTVLQNALWARTGTVQLHGPTVAWGLDVEDAASESSLLAAIRSGAQRWPLGTFGRFLRGASLHGTLVGGNLASLNVLLGTPFAPAWDGAVLLWEEVHEPISGLDRLLTHLDTAGVFARISGMVVGHLEAIDERYAGTITRALDVVMERVARHGFPVLQTELVGHPRPRVTLPIGGTITADAEAVVVTSHARGD